VKSLAVAGIAPRVWDARRSDDPLSRLVVLFPSADTRSQGARDDLVPLFLARMDMFSNREAGRENDVDSQLFAIRLPSRHEKGYADAKRRKVDEVAGSGHGQDPLHDVEPRHHGVVFMFEVVTMQEVSTAIGIEPDRDPCLLTALQSDRVLPAGFVWTGRQTVSIDYLERCEMDMDRMKETG
jgi:hypothetical protein